jgi:hypothetical protein
MVKFKATTLLLLFAPGLLFAQYGWSSNSGIKAQSISVKVLGPPAWPLGLSYGQMLTERLSLELGVGLLSCGAGFDYYLTNPRERRFAFHTGLYGGYIYDSYPIFHIPVGVSFFGNSNFQYSLNSGLLYQHLRPGADPDATKYSPWLGLSIGKRFGQEAGYSRSESAPDEKNIVSARAGFVFPLAGLGYERLLSPNLGLEATIGLIGASAGANLYLPAMKPGKLGFKTGFAYGVMVFPLVGVLTSAYVPIGMNYLSRRNFVLSVDAGPQYWYGERDYLIGFSVKVGKVF